jgi:hypothetical protein
MLNGIFYRIPSELADESNIQGLGFAFQGDASTRTLPLQGELVHLTSLPAPGSGGVQNQLAKYWTKTIPIFNHPNHNAIPDTKQEEWQDALLGVPTATEPINPLQANPGDMILEGRLGQSIRLGGYKGVQSKNIDSSNNGKPIMLFSNGQIKTEEGNTPIEEDVNVDFNSIYLLSDHRVPLLAANNKRDSYTDVPKTADQFKGNQVIVNGGRLFFNAKEESAFISAKESIGLNAKTLNLDATEYFCVDSKKIFLGKAARTSKVKEPVILGKQLENWLISLLNTLEVVGSAMELAKTVDGKSIISLNTTGPMLRSTVQSLKKQFALFQSKKVFTE